MQGYNDFFQLFIDFKSYCEYFYLQDLTINNFSGIKYYLPFNDFELNPYPKTISEYKIYKNNVIEFNIDRNNRIQKYIFKKEKLNYYKNIVKANNGKLFYYSIDPSGKLANYSSISTDVNRKKIQGEIKIISTNIIEIMKNENVEELDHKEWNYEKMLGCYYDNEGIFYYNIDNNLYPYKYRSKYLENYYKNNH